MARALRSVDSALNAAPERGSAPLDERAPAAVLAASHGLLAERGFRAFDDALGAPSPALVLVLAIEPEDGDAQAQLSALAAHALRRLGPGAALVSRDGASDLATSIESAWSRRASTTRGAAPGTSSLEQLRSMPLVGARPLVVVDRCPGRYSSAVFDALLLGLERHGVSMRDVAEGASSAPTVVWIRSCDVADAARSAARPSAAARVVVVGGEVDAIEAGAWWSVAAAAVPLPATDATAGASRVTAVSLAGLERWWTRLCTQELPRAEVDLGGLDAPTRSMLDALSAVGRPWPLHALDRLASSFPLDVSQRPDRPALAASLDRLVTEGLVLRSNESVLVSRIHLARTSGAKAEGAAAPGSTLAALEWPSHARLDLAEVLAETFPTDAWALARAAELALDAGSGTRAGELARAAFASNRDPDARGELLDRLAVGLEAHRGRGATLPTDLLFELVQLAEQHGEVDTALRLGRLLLAAAPGDARALLAVGRVDLTRGDHATAELTLARAARSDDDEVATAARVELAELAYAAGDLQLAQRRVDEVLAALDAGGAPVAASRSGSRASARLAARNVQGKLLLAAASFSEAERHFIEDALDAQLAALPLPELRARVNRAIAAMSLGRRAEARAMLEEVLEESQRQHELRATAMAVTNLATIAILEHRHLDALRASEHAVDALRRTGERPRVVRATANLAELRLWMGLVDEADDAIRFARASLRGALAPGHAAHLSLVSARVRFARGDTASSWRALHDLFGSLGSPELLALERGTSRTVHGGSIGKLCSEALRLGARLALSDGDVDRARALLARASEEPATPRGRAEQALLTALLARAAGEDAELEPLVRSAVAACTEADDDELVREALVVAHRVSLERGADDDAARWLRAALATRDRVVDGLPAAIAERFLARPELGELAALERAARADASEPIGPSTSRSGAPVSLARRSGAARPTSTPARGLIGRDPAIRSLLAAVRKVGPHDATVLIHGESGTGKELVADALHAASARAAAPLVKVNCAALVETLLLSELFGHEKGSFTGAASRRRGRFEAAEGGTLFLDEIGDISPATQVALLRVLQERSFERVGGTATIRADVRVVCATHRDLKSLVAKGLFREDLYYRLCGVVLEVPALRERIGDLEDLSVHLLERIAAERGTEARRVSRRALSALRQHAWPGNVRELENALRAASLFAEGEELELEDFTDNVESLRALATSTGLDTIQTATSASPEGGASGLAVAASCGVNLAASASAHAERPRSCAPAESSREMAVAPASVPDVAYASIRSGTSLHDVKRLIERECVARALGESGGNITRAATLLGMKRPRLSQLVKQYGLGGEGDLGATLDSDGEED